MLRKTAEALRRNRYEVSVFETHEEAVEYLSGLFHGATVGFGDSRTLAQIGLSERLSRENTVYDPFPCTDNDEFLAVARQCLTTDYFFTSINGKVRRSDIKRYLRLATSTPTTTATSAMVTTFITWCSFRTREKGQKTEQRI